MSSHDDLMVAFQAEPDTLQAIYFDSEGHVINDKLTLEFEIAMPDRPDQFNSFMTATAHKI